MCRAVIVDCIYEDAERIVPLDPGLTVHEVVARLAKAHPDLFTAQDPARPLPAFPDGLRFRLPTLAVGTDPSGQPDYILQRTWHTRTLADGETIAFVVVPRGGRGGSNAGKQIAGVIAMLALTIAAPYLVAGLGIGALGTAAGALTMAGRLAAMGIVAGGAALINALQPKTAGPATDETRVYSAAAANNSLQPGGIVPVAYGLNRWAPPFATRPYVEYENNEQYLYQVLCVGKGHHAIKRVLYGDTTVWTADDGPTGTIEGLELEFCGPGQGVGLFPAGVVVASEVAGQEIPNPAQWPPYGPFEPTWLGGFVVNGAGAANRIDRIAIDWYMPEGIYAQGSGGISAFGADLLAQYRQIDDAGDPVGGWVTFVGDGTGENGGKRYWGASREPQRYTEKVDVPKGRYEVRVAAAYPFQPANSDAKNRTLWAGLKGYLADFATPPGVTQIAVKIQAGHDLSELAASQFFVESVRKLPVWDPETETWSAPVETRSIAWAVADWLRNADYGGGIADADIDLGWLAAYAPFWEARGDTFNGIFDREWMLLDGANAILRCGRSQVVRIGDRIGFTRYEAKDVKRAVFTPRTIVRGSFKRRWIFSDESLPDSKYCKFLDAQTWQYDEIKVAAPDYGSSRPVEETMFGFVDREHVWREGVTDCAINAFRDREFVSFTTEWDGKRLVRGDPVLVVHPLMANAFARIDAADGATLSLDRDIARALIPQWVDDAADWTAVNAGAPVSVASLPGSFVEDGPFGRRVAVRSGTATNPIRAKRTVAAPLDDTILELQVRWRVVGAGEGRIVARCVSLDEGFAQIAVGGEAAGLVSGPAQRLSRFFFATPATAAAVGGVTAWHAAARHLRFGVNVNAGEGGAEVRIAQIRVRAVHGLQDRIYVRGRDGREWGFCDVAAIPDDRTVVLDAVHLAAVEAGDGPLVSILPGPRAEKAHLALFQDDARPFDGLMVSARPTGPNRVDVLLVRDDPRPYTADGTGGPPTYLPPRKPPAPPDRPLVTGLSARLENGDFDVNLVAGWLPAPGARAYVAKVSYDAGESWQHVWRGREPSFTVPTLRQPQTVRVRAIGRLPGPWAEAEIAEIAVPPVRPPRNPVPPGPPTGLSALGGLSQALVEWTNPDDDDLSHVVVLVHTADDAAAARVAGSMTAPGDSLVVTDLASDTDYWFWAYAVDVDGNASTVAGPATARTRRWPFGPPNTEAPGEPTDPVLTPGLNLILAEWTNPADDDLADIEVWINDADDLGSARLVATARAPGASAVVGDLPNNSQRWFWLRAVDYWGNKSDFVACGAATTLNFPFGDPNTDPPGLPTAPSLSPGFHLIEISWTNPADDDLADIEVWAHTANDLGQARHIGSARAPGSSYVAAGLGNNATWWFWLRAVDYWGNKSDFVACGQATTFAGTADIANNAISSEMIQALAILPAKLADNAVTVAKIANGAVEAGKIAANAVGSAHLQNLAVTEAKVAAAAITTAKIADAAVAAGKIAANAVGSAHLQNLAVTEAKVAAAAITTAKIADAAVAAGKIAASAVGESHLQNLAVTAAKVAAAAIETAKLANGAITTVKISDDAITAPKILAGSITTAKIAAAAVTATEIAAATITGAKIAAGTITGSNIAANTIQAAQIAAATITAAELAAGSVTTAKIAAGAVTATAIAAATITGAKIAAGTITGSNIAANTIQAAQIAAATITAAELAAGSVTTAKIAAGAVTATEIAAGAVVADKIAANAVTASKMVLTDTANLILNGSLEAPDGSLSTDGWVFTNNADAVSPEGIFAGYRRHGFRFTGGAGVASLATWNRNIPVVPGESYAPKIDVFRQNPADGFFRMQVMWLDLDGGVLSSVNVLSLDGAKPGNTWASHAGAIVTVPAAARYMRWRIFTTADHTTGVWMAINAIVRKAANAELIVDGAILAEKIAANAVTTAKLAAGAVTAGTIAAGAVTAGTIAANAVTATEIAALTIVAGNIAAGTITGAKIAATTITGGLIAANTITAAQIAANTITATEIASLTITANQIAANAIVAAKIAADAVTTAKLNANSVTTAKLAAGAVTATEIAAGAITSAKLAAGAIVAGKISAGAIDAAELFVNGVIITDLIEQNAVQAPRYTNPANVNWIGRSSGQEVVVAELTLPVATSTAFVEAQFTCRTTAAIAVGGGNASMSVQLRINGVTVYSEAGAARSGEGSTTVTNRGFGFLNPGAGDRTVQLVVVCTWTGNLAFSSTQVTQIRLKATAPKR